MRINVGNGIPYVCCKENTVEEKLPEIIVADFSVDGFKLFCREQSAFCTYTVVISFVTFNIEIDTESVSEIRARADRNTFAGLKLIGCNINGLIAYIF